MWFAESKAIQNPPLVETKKLDTSLSMNLRPPPAERHKSFDEDDSTPRKPIVVAKKPAVVLPSNVKAYTVADLQIATNSFSVDNLLGEGTFGRVYRAQFDDGKVIKKTLITNPFTIFVMILRYCLFLII